MKENRSLRGQRPPHMERVYVKVNSDFDPVERKLVFLAANERSAGKEISIDDILEIHGDLVDYMDDI